MPADKPSPDRFVIRPLAAAEAARLPKLPAAFKLLGELASPKGGWQVELGCASAHAGWRMLQGELGPRFQVLPVMSGETGPRFPTGEIVVRFAAPVSDAQLRAFEASEACEFVRRSPFTVNQALFRAHDAAASFAPDLVERLARRDDIEAAWLDTESVYRRSG